MRTDAEDKKEPTELDRLIQDERDFIEELKKILKDPKASRALGAGAVMLPHE